MSLKKLELKSENLFLTNDKRDIKILLSSYEISLLQDKVLHYVNSLVNNTSKTTDIVVAPSSYGYIAVERPLDLAIAKIVACPSLVKSITPLYDYICDIRKNYEALSDSFFNEIKVKCMTSPINMRYLPVDKFLPLEKDYINSFLNRPDFINLLRRSVHHYFQNFVKVRVDYQTGKYVCEQNVHFLAAYQLLRNFDEYEFLIPESYREELSQAAIDPFFDYIRVDDDRYHPLTLAVINLKYVHFSFAEDIFYSYIHKDVDMFSQLINNIIDNGLKPFQVNAYVDDKNIYSPLVGIYPLLALNAINNLGAFNAVFPDIANSLGKKIYQLKNQLNSFVFLYQEVDTDSYMEFGMNKVIGSFSIKGTKNNSSVAELDIDPTAEENDGVEENETEEEDINPGEILLDEKTSVQDEIFPMKDELKNHTKSVTETIDINISMTNELIDERMSAPIKYGVTVLKLDEIEGFDFRYILEDGLNPHYKQEIIDYLTLRQEFPLLKAIPTSEGLYRVNLSDQKRLFARMVAYAPKIIKSVDEKFYNNLLKLKQFYDVKKTIPVEVRVPTEEKSKKGNIFHHLTDGKLNRALLKKPYDELTLEEAIEISVIHDKDILERFNPIKDPIIFYRTVRSFLECLFHLYYAKLDRENIYHDNGKWTDKFKPLSQWVSMFTHIRNKKDCADQVFPPEIWEAYKDSFRMDVVFVLNEITHMSSSASRYQEECRDFIWQNIMMERVVIYMLNNVR